MTRFAKIFTGILTASPLVLGIVFYVNYILTFITYMPAHAAKWGNSNNPIAPMQDMIHHIFSPFMIICLAACIILHFAMMTWYIIDVTRNRPKTEIEMVMWILLFIFLGSIPEFIYFFLRVVPREKAIVS